MKSYFVIVDKDGCHQEWASSFTRKEAAENEVVCKDEARPERAPHQALHLLPASEVERREREAFEEGVQRGCSYMDAADRYPMGMDPKYPNFRDYLKEREQQSQGSEEPKE